MNNICENTYGSATATAGAATSVIGSTGKAAGYGASPASGATGEADGYGANLDSGAIGYCAI